MRINQIIAIAACLFCINTSFAADENRIEFFASNNTGEITLETAYSRLIGKEQYNLQDSMINLLQENHIEQGRFKDILGTYQMASDTNITGDNTEVFTASPYQPLTKQKIFSLATELANHLNQESVAVFIPDEQSGVGNIKVKFTSRHPSINETIQALRSKLPPAYYSAFSLHLSDMYTGFNNVTVSEIEWLGSHIELEKIKTAFPQENLTYQNGSAFLIYKNGENIRL